ncbi:YidC/Oxa1 family membrane protein insertase, partial [Candidatus Aerophobetes bacterium]|nr:YidC/Oxa1 family membrane protein insertase [Candidatus Aerophobetes bacterium]
IKNLGKPDIPLLLALAGCMFLQQRISQKMQKSADETGITKIMQFFPFFLIIILWSLPSGVMLYWFTSTLISILQQFFIRKKSAKISIAET